MPHNRFYVPAALEEGASLLLEDTEYHHLHTAMRAQQGDRVELVNGQGILAQARITALGKKTGQLHIEQILKSELPPGELILALALTRPSHLEWAIEKGTELGASSFWLFPGVLSDKQELSPSQKTRLNHLIIAAFKQCGRLHLPTLLFKPRLAQWEPLPGRLLLADTSPEAPYFWDVQAPSITPWIWVIGPEKGFHPREISHLKEVLKATSVRLHPHILRAETAPLVALCLSWATQSQNQPR